MDIHFSCTLFELHSGCTHPTHGLQILGRTDVRPVIWSAPFFEVYEGAFAIASPSRPKLEPCIMTRASLIHATIVLFVRSRVGTVDTLLVGGD